MLSYVGVQYSFAQKADKKLVSKTEKEISIEKVENYSNMDQVLELTSDQKEKIRLLFTEVYEKKNTIIRDQKNVEKRKAELLELNDAKTHRLKQILTVEQYNQYLKML